jgi:hypothetical protein
MKTFCLNIDPELKNVVFQVNKGAAFERDLLKGTMKCYQITLRDSEYKRVARFALKRCNSYYSSRGRWHAQCYGYSMGLTIFGLNGLSRRVEISTYRPYGTSAERACAPCRKWVKF